MYKVNRKVDVAVERFNKYANSNNCFLKIYRSAAIFEPLPDDRDNTVILKPELMLDNDRLVMPFNAMLFDLQDFSNDGSEIYAMLNNIDDREDNGSILTVISIADYAYTVISMLYRIQIENDGFSFYTPPEAYYASSIDKGKNWEVEMFNIYEPILKDVFETTSEYILEYLSIINNQEFFIVENKTSYKVPGIGRKKKTVNRSTFTIDKPREIRKRYNNQNYEEGNGTPLKIGQERRAHWRYFKSDRFVNMKGKRTRIKAYWAGPSSFTDPEDPHKRYIVRLDL